MATRILPKIEPGFRFGLLTVIRQVLIPDKSTGLNRIYLDCKCDCGLFKTIYAYNIRRGFTKSCGCNKEKACREKVSTHGLSRTPEYESWCHMYTRCNNPKYPLFYRYGGRGIKVCDRWRTSFESFLADMGNKPTPSHSLDRINNDGNYEPSNCRWATAKEQSRNTRRNKFVTFANGDKLMMTDAIERAIVNKATVRRRMRDGWPVLEAIETPALTHRLNYKAALASAMRIEAIRKAVAP